MGWYRWVLLIKFIGVAVFTGGCAMGLFASTLEDRRRAVHQVASPALFAIWIAGYALASQLDVSLMELWTLGAMVLSTCVIGVLSTSVKKDVRSAKMFVAVFVPFVLVLALMVFRPTWSTLLGR